jgi:hypothetical protein
MRIRILSSGRSSGRARVSRIHIVVLEAADQHSLAAGVRPVSTSKSMSTFFKSGSAADARGSKRRGAGSDDGLLRGLGISKRVELALIGRGISMLVTLEPRGLGGGSVGAS